MKSSALALMTAAALMFGANATAFAQEASSATTTAPASAAECHELQEGAMPSSESLVADQENEADEQSATGGETSESDATGAIDDTTPIDCPEGTSTGAAMTGGSAAATGSDASGMTALTPEECLALQGAGATPAGESLVNEQESDSDNQTATGTESSATDATGAIDDENPAGCADVTETNDE